MLCTVKCLGTDCSHLCLKNLILTLPPYFRKQLEFKMGLLKNVVIITTSLVIVAAIVVAIAVPLSKRDASARERAEEWMSETPLIDGYVTLFVISCG